MNIIETLESLENSWSRKEILQKLHNGEKPEFIVNEFLSKNQKDIKNLNKFFKSQHLDFLKKMEELSLCEAHLIKTINSLSISENLTNQTKLDVQKISLSNKQNPSKLTSFMMEWSNKLVFIALLIISGIALTKQAWV